MPDIRMKITIFYTKRGVADLMSGDKSVSASPLFVCKKI